MARPKLNDGYIKIVNELYEQFYIRNFKLFQLKILLFVMRYSYGCNKKEAIITPQNNFCLLHLHECDIKRELKSLEQAKVLICDYKNGVFSINKNFDEWQVGINNLYDEEKNAKLLKKNLCKSQSDDFVNHKENFAKNKDENLCEKQSTLQNTKKNLCKSQSDDFVNHKELQAENTSCDEVSNPSKYILNTSKDNNKIYINNNKPQDPYFGNATTEFKKQYQLIFKKQCFLNNFQLQKLAEIPATVPNFIELIPVLLQKFSKVSFNFDGEVKKPGLRWLIEEGNWADVLNGKFDETEKQQTEVSETGSSQEQCWSAKEAFNFNQKMQQKLSDSAYDL